MLPHAQAFLTDLVSHKARKINTSEAYRGDLEKLAVYLNDSLGRPASLEDISAVRVAAFLKKEQRSGLSPRTLARRKAALRQYARYLRSQSEKKNQFEAIENVLGKSSFLPPAPESKITKLSKAESERLKALLSESTRPLTRRDRAIFSILLDTGIPVGHLVGLDCRDFVTAMAKLRSPAEGHWIQLSREGAGRALGDYLGQGRPELNPASAVTALFISQTGSRMSRQGVWQALRIWGRRAELPFPLSPRVLQYSAVQRLCEQGISLERLGEHLGHTNLESTRALVRRLDIRVN